MKINEPVESVINEVKGDLLSQWIRGSVFVKDGKPMRFYHGSSRSFDQFDDINNMGGFYFFPEKYKDLTEPFAAGSGEVGGYEKERQGQQVYVVYLKSKKPLDLRRKPSPQFIKQIQKLADKEGPDSPLHYSVEDLKQDPSSYWELFDDKDYFLNAVKELGYDSVLLQETGGWSVMVFEPHQIKSAIGNRGTFDSKSKKIHESL